MENCPVRRNYTLVHWQRRDVALGRLHLGRSKDVTCLRVFLKRFRRFSTLRELRQACIFLSSQILNRIVGVVLFIDRGGDSGDAAGGEFGLSPHGRSLSRKRWQNGILLPRALRRAA